ncbi:hypothetical protein NNRS527_01384 [Nitrosospira sp. NRS527]|nr:hypothetical protein NNRS527_01384 [Nitrosospira sp. NRS527]
MKASKIALSTNRPFKRHELSRLVEARSPSINRSMIHQASGIDICHSFQGKLVAFYFKSNPRGQRLFYDPALGTIKSSRELINLFRKFIRNVSGDDTCIHI